MLLSMLFSLFLACGPKANVPTADYKLDFQKLPQYNISINDFVFPSGLRILFQPEDTQPIIAITAFIDRGSEHDPKGVEGIAHIVEHLVFRAKHSDEPGAMKNWDYIKKLGGTINASTSVDWTNYMTIAPKDATIPLLRIEALRMKDGVKNVTEQDVRTEVEIARNELRMRYENAALSAAWGKIGPELYPEGHAYSRSTIGTHESISKINLQNVRQFVVDNYRPEYTTIVIAGDLRNEKGEMMNLGNDVIFKAFEGNEDLLMAPVDAQKYNELKDRNSRIDFLNNWVKNSLQPYMQTNPKLKPRIDCASRDMEPLVPNQKQGDKLPVIKGMVKNTNLVVAWSLPGGYCTDQATMEYSASMLGNHITNHLWTSGSDRDENQKYVGCYLSPSQYYSTLACFVDKSSRGLSKLSNEQVLEKVQNALYLQWQKYDPNMVNVYMRKMFMQAQMSRMAGLLQSADSVSNLFSGRATATAGYTHFTGDPLYFSSNLNMLADPNINGYAVQKVAEKYITRDRAIGVVVEPMDAEERMRREQVAGKATRADEIGEYHATTSGDRFGKLFDKSKVTPELIKNQLITPRLEKLHRFTLDNGLEVAVLPYGDVPLVRLALRLKGDPSFVEKPLGIDSLSESVFSTGNSSEEKMLAVAGYISKGKTSVMASSVSQNLSAALNKMRWQVEDYRPSGFFDRRKTVNNWMKRIKTAPAKAGSWATIARNELLFSGHPIGETVRPKDIEVLAALDTEGLAEWLHTKWQPKNAELIVVGRLDPKEAEKEIRTYFNGWKYKGTGQPGELGYMAKPKKKPNRTVYLFDDPIATQTQVLLMCQIDVDDHLLDKSKANVVSGVLSERAWRKLREEKGVTYGAYAYNQVYKGGTGVLGISSLVQNDATGYAVKTMLDIIEDGSKANFEGIEQSIADEKIKMAREFVLGQQSGDQMLARLSSVGIKHFDYFDKLPDALSKVSKEDFVNTLKPCVGHEVITVIGPVENAEKDLKEKKVDYEIYDWEKRYKEDLTEEEWTEFKEMKDKAEKARKDAEAKKKKEEKSDK